MKQDYSKMTYGELKQASDAHYKVRNEGLYSKWYDEQMEINSYLVRYDYHGRLLEVGDKVTHVFGKGLRTSVIEEILEFRSGGCGPNIKVKGLKTPIHNGLCIKD